MTAERLFVYGSLKRGERHHRELAGARFLGEAKTLAGYALVALGDYLALVQKAGAGSVVGELYELPFERFSALDEFEGPEYERVWLEVEVRSDAEKVKALAYVKRAR
jgi:gamma-glutamylaminecyclotransferase